MQKRNIIWLASYPKSGNTWFRAFLTALLGESEDINLNGLKIDGIFSSREIFDAFTDLDSTYLYDTEVKLLLPQVFTALSSKVDKPQYIKIHDAYSFNKLNQPIVPSEATKCAIYIIRNPLDIVASFANHMASTIDQAVRIMNNPKGRLATQKGNHNTNNQFSQLLFSWSGHIQSWTQQFAFPIHVMRYEDMLQDPLETFSLATQFMDIKASDKQLIKAIEATTFNKLQQKEQQTGFFEKNTASPAFFRSGKSGNWRNELTRKQAQSILDNHAEVMSQYGYNVDLDGFIK